MEEMKVVNTEELENVAGGLIVDDKAANKFWIIKQNGDVIAPSSSREKAIEAAKAFNTSTQIITREEYKKRFGRDLKFRISARGL